MSVTSTERTYIEVQTKANVSGVSRKRWRAFWRQNTPWLSFFPPLVVAALILWAWFASTAKGGVQELILPAPGEVWTLLMGGISSGVFWRHAGITMQESLFGFFIAFAIALPLGYSLAKWRILSVTLQPYLALGQAIPAIVIAPLLSIWLGYGQVPVVVVCLLVVLFPLMITIILGMTTIDPLVKESARVEGASSWRLFWHIELPLSLPAVVMGVRVGLIHAIIGALVGEVVLSPDQGLGGLMQMAKSQYNTGFMFATLIVLSCLALCYYGASWFCGWLANRMYQ